MKKDRFILFAIILFIAGSSLFLIAKSKIFINAKEETTKQTNSAEKSYEVIIQFAKDGLKSFREVDYQDEDYEGFKDPEVFAIGFRNAIVIGKAKERLTEVQSKKIYRKIDTIKLISIKVNDNIANVEFKVTEKGTEQGKDKTQIYNTNIILIKQAGLWLISNIQLDFNKE